GSGRANRRLNRPSAIGLRQVLPVQTKTILRASAVRMSCSDNTPVRVIVHRVSFGRKRVTGPGLAGPSVTTSAIDSGRLVGSYGRPSFNSKSASGACRTASTAAGAEWAGTQAGNGEPSRTPPT